MVSVSGTIEYPKRKEGKKLDPCLTHHIHTKMNSSWIVDKNVKGNTISLI